MSLPRALVVVCALCSPFPRRRAEETTYVLTHKQTKAAAAAQTKCADAPREARRAA
jgi:hypothetical protein